MITVTEICVVILFSTSIFLSELPSLKNGNRPKKIPSDKLPKHMQKKKGGKAKIMLEVLLLCCCNLAG
jgi:hypothetical protein